MRDGDADEVVQTDPRSIVQGSTVFFLLPLLQAWPRPGTGGGLWEVGRRKRAPPMLGVVDEHKPTRGYRHVHITAPANHGAANFWFLAIQSRQLAASTGVVRNGRRRAPINARTQIGPLPPRPRCERLTK